jgi:hypothetical protein
MDESIVPQVTSGKKNHDLHPSRLSDAGMPGILMERVWFR